MNTPNPLDYIVSAHEAAEMAGVSVRRIQQAIQRDEIRCKRIGREWALDVGSVRAWAAAPRQVGRPPKKLRPDD